MVQQLGPPAPDIQPSVHMLNMGITVDQVILKERSEHYRESMFWLKGGPLQAVALTLASTGHLSKLTNFITIQVLTHCIRNQDCSLTGISNMHKCETTIPSWVHELTP
jgi:glycogen synthase